MDFGDFRARGDQPTLVAPLVSHGFNNILLGFLKVPWTCMNFGDLGARGDQSTLVDPLVSHGFNNILIRYLYDFHGFSIGFCDFGARGDQKTFGRLAGFPWF